MIAGSIGSLIAIPDLQLIKSADLNYDSPDNIEIKQLLRFKDDTQSI